MIDLSFLTEEEQGAILAVLKRDAELKKAEEHRVQKLQTTVGDRGQLRYLTGEWFYETKQLRHQDRIHGSDIIRASMRHTHKPLTILELSQMLPEQPSFVDSENRDVFVPPVLCGLLEEPHTQRSDERFQNQNPSDPSPHTPKAVLQSPTKRENPFNSELNAHHTFEQQDGQLSDEDVDHSQKLNEDVSGHRHSERLNPVLCSPDSAEPGHDSPIVSALKRLSSRMSSSKSLENLTSQSREEHDSRQQMNSSVDDASSLPPPASSLSNSKQMKTSVSVPVLQQDETDSDSTFENNLGRRRNTGSSTSNISLSSGMASMSSVSGSVSSISPADFGDIEVQGNIQLAVNYIQKLGEFHIFVVHCRELAVADSKKNRSDPYVKCYLVPDKTKLGKRKTTVRKKNLNPNYNEILRFKIIMEVLKTERLNVSVWHNDTFGRNSFLGEVDLDLSEWDFSNTQINEYALKARESAQTSDLPSPSRLMDSRGQMRLALRFLPQTSHSKRTSRMETGEVQIWVKDCKSLPSVRGVMIDPFVKCTVLPDRSRKSRQKTRVVKRTANPMFNHTMVYDGFRAEDLREACVEITVWDHDRLNSHYIGGLRLGLGTGKSYGLEVLWMDSTTAEADLWQRMLQSDGEWVEEVLPLRMFVLAKSNSK
ncbi:synaptotagmin-like protein 2 isoform X5 [Scophthalmus maximus]|uniref:synaptotagmin-like protein 2 isoform X5 n=1 Tax=Scophthalmus maximus TaxID=52904 RepID=UPI0015E0DAA4|nr:synaptotagmin-like protein 2 isoform X5 [Scophthalmus maximus]